MTNRNRIWVEHAGERIAVARWGDADASKPPALLVHGTGFVAEVWDEVARGLAHRYTVYGIDRRGHGSSHKPSLDQYHFLDFASDVRAAVETLDLTDIFGVGHSAGATDLLLAAHLMPGRFSRLFVMEPTIMDPRARVDGGLSEKAPPPCRARCADSPNSRTPQQHSTAIARRRRSRCGPRTRFRAYVRHGFETLPDGRVRLLCRPEIEAAMLRPIFEAMEQVYAGDERGNPFGLLSAIDCPVRVATAENSWAIYKEMAARAVALIPGASQWTFDGVGHCVAQEAPAQLLLALEAFEAERRRSCLRGRNAKCVTTLARPWTSRMHNQSDIMISRAQERRRLRNRSLQRGTLAPLRLPA